MADVEPPVNGDASTHMRSVGKKRKPLYVRWALRLARQELKGWSPIITANSVVIFYFFLGCVLIPLGIAILVASLGVKEYVLRYDDQGPLAGLQNPARYQLLQGGSGVQPYNVSVTVDADLDPPVYLYYELDNFYQNHKRYVRSVANKQVAGTNQSAGSLGRCEPILYVDGAFNASRPQGGLINPCGLVAWSFFNDSFALAAAAPSAAAAPLAVDENDISWSFDRDHLYGAYDPVNYNIYPPERGGNTTYGPLNQQEHWIVWMRVAAHKSFRKLYGRIDQRIAKGTNITVTVQNRYNTYQFGGAKKVVLSTNSWVGGRNNFLGIMFIIVGSLAFIASFAFFAAYHLALVHKRPFGDLNYLSWNRQ